MIGVVANSSKHHELDVCNIILNARRERPKLHHLKGFHLFYSQPERKFQRTVLPKGWVPMDTSSKGYESHKGFFLSYAHFL